MEEAQKEGSPDTTFLIVPPEAESGMMEDVILRVLSDDPSWPCHHAFFKCLDDKGIDLEADHQKRRVQAGLSSLSSRSLARNIGEAAQKGLINFDHPALTELSRFLTLICP